VDFTPGDRPVVLLTGSGRAVMKGERPARLVLPREHGAGLLLTTAPKGSGGPTALKGSGGPTALKGSGGLPPEAAARFETLRRLRLELARRDGVPPFVVASDRTLRDVAVLRPRTLDELQQAYGIGAAKAERYGARLLEAIAERDPP